MNERELRQLVRDSIARVANRVGPPLSDPGSDQPAFHASFGRLPVVRGADEDGACIIEPAVRCNHCGYCQSYGH